MPGTATTIISNLTQLTTPSDHLQRDVSGVLTKLSPDRFPLDTLTRSMPRGEAARATKIEWVQKGELPRTDTVAADIGAGGAGAYVDVTVSKVSMWRVDDVLIAPYMPTLGMLWVSAINGNNLRCYQVGVRSISVPTGFGTVPAIANGTTLAWLGNAKQEFAYMSTPKIGMPDYSSNMCELSDTVVKVSGTREKTRNYTTTNDWDEARVAYLMEFRKSLEAKRWFGIVGETIDPTSGELRWTQNGVTRYIAKTVTYDPNVQGQRITEGALIDWLVYIFSGNNGSETRFLFADSYLLGELLKVDLVNLRTRQVETVLGVKVERVTFNFGTLFVKHARIFNELGYNHYGVVLDMEGIRLRELQPLERVELLLKQTGYNGRGEQYIEQASLEVRNPDAHCIIQGVSS